MRRRGTSGRRRPRVQAPAERAISTATRRFAAVVASPTLPRHAPRPSSRCPFSLAGTRLADGGIPKPASDGRTERPTEECSGWGACTNTPRSSRTQPRPCPPRTARSPRTTGTGRRAVSGGASCREGYDGGRATGNALSGPEPLRPSSQCATRFGIFEAGVASAKDPKYTVVPPRAPPTRRRLYRLSSGFCRAAWELRRPTSCSSPSSAVASAWEKTPCRWRPA